ncbi:hypothetical protein, partial [Parasphingorhabdus sp.]|uniref:hypothetical protein n=1 Tax=Parasphingorhabdus sp. TaxID=2709688 RepID=UPI002F92EF73
APPPRAYEISLSYTIPDRYDGEEEGNWIWGRIFRICAKLVKPGIWLLVNLTIPDKWRKYVLPWCEVSEV